MTLHDPKGLRHCADTDDPEKFHPEKGHSARPARRMCLGDRRRATSACPLLTECLRSAMQWPTVQGIWAGTNEHQRRTVRRLMDVGVPVEAIDPVTLPPNTSTPDRLAHLVDLYGQYGVTVEDVTPRPRSSTDDIEQDDLEDAA